MTTLTDRYIDAVITQLPEGQRKDLAQELRGTIEDTIAASPHTDPIEAERAALRELGHPQKLADGYRGTGRSLIGPRYYPAWLRTVKSLIVVVPLLVAGIMLVLGLLDADTDNGGVVGEAITSALWATVMVLFWVTLGFAIAERSGDATVLGVLGDGREEDWDPDDLPEPQERQVSWGDSIFQIVLNVFLLVLLLLPTRLGGSVDGTSWGQIFTDSAYDLRWVLAIGVALSLLATIVVMVRSHWTWASAIVNAVGTALFVLPIVWLASRDDLYAWDTLPLGWVAGDGSGGINEGATLWISVIVVVAIGLWDVLDGLRKASRTVS